MRRWYLVLVFVCSGWGTIPLAVRSVHLPAPAIVFARVAIGAAGLALALAVDARRRGPADGAERHSDGAASPSPRRPTPFSYRPGACARVGAVLALHWCCLFAAYARIAPGTVILVVYLAPVGIAAVSPFVLGERPARFTLLALSLAVAGFLLVAAPAVGGASAAGLGLAIAAAGTFVALVVLSKPLAVHYGGLRLAFIEMSVATLVLLPVAANTGWGSPRAAWLWLVVLGLGHTAVGTGLYLAALAHVPATSVGILGYLEPISVVVVSWLVLGVRPSLITVAGGALIVAAGVWVVRSSPVAVEQEVISGAAG